MYRNTTERFWALVDMSDPDGCWPFLRPNKRYGYGQFFLDGKTWQAHRLAWTLRHGPIPEGIDVLHTCDNRACCRDDHHFLGDDAANVADAVAKGRHVHPVIRGVACKHALLNPEKVRLIRSLRAEGMARAAIAARFQVSVSAVNNVLYGYRWAYVT